MKIKFLFIVFILMLIYFFISSYMLDNFCIEKMDRLHTFIHQDKILTCYMKESHYYALRASNGMSFVLSLMFCFLLFYKKIVNFISKIKSSIK